MSPPAPPVPPVAVVTGANRGIGRAITVAFAAAGFAVAASARDPASLADTVAEAGKAGGTAVPVACDVRDEASVAALAERAEQIGPVHTVVANAGIAGPTAPLHEITLADWRETIATDLDGVFLTFRAFIPAMIAAPGRQPDRDLVHDRQAPAARPHALRRGEDGRHRAGPHARHRTRAAPHPGQRGLPRLRRRAADRAGAPPQAAVRGIAEETVRAEVTALSPLRRMVRPEEVAATCVYLASGDSAAITGEDLNVTAGVVMY